MKKSNNTKSKGNQITLKKKKFPFISEWLKLNNQMTCISFWKQYYIYICIYCIVYIYYIYYILRFEMLKMR